MVKVKHYLVAYDISKTKIRTKVADTLEEIGTRINKSVFLCEQNYGSSPEDIANKISPYITKTDQIFIVPLCHKCLSESLFLQDRSENKRKQKTKFV